MFALSIVACALLITNVWRKWNESPVMVSFAAKSSPVSQFPFPAITICTKNKIQMKKYNMTEKVDELFNFSARTQQDLDKYNDIILLCEENMRYFVNSRKHGNVSIINNILSVTPDVDRIFGRCEWREIDYPCDTLFTRTLTNKGECFTFNSLSSDEIFRNENTQQEYNYTKETTTSNGWSLEHGYSSKSLDVYPRRGRNFGASPDLKMTVFEHKSDIFPRCYGLVRGFEVLLHHPSEKPTLSQYYIEVRPGEEKKIAIKMKIQTISESLKNYSPAARQCYFPNERFLRYFKMYTQKNCELECLSNNTFAMCGCVPYYMPHNDSYHVCSSGAEIKCVERASEYLADSLAEYTSAYTQTDNEILLNGLSSSCQCMPACDSISYEADTSGSDMDLVTYMKSFNFDKEIIAEFEDMMISRMSFFFKDSQFISTHRSELYGHTDFLANCGGLLGLFHGFSVLSLIEIVYYMTLRLVCVIRRLRIAKIHEKETNDKRV